MPRYVDPEREKREAERLAKEAGLDVNGISVPLQITDPSKPLPDMVQEMYCHARATGDSHADACHTAGITAGAASVWAQSEVVQNRINWIHERVNRELYRESIASATEIAERMTGVLRADIADYMDEDGFIDVKKIKEKPFPQAISAIRYGKGGVSIELRSPAEAARLLMELRGSQELASKMDLLRDALRGMSAEDLERIAGPELAGPIRRVFAENGDSAFGPEGGGAEPDTE